tara:strand:- start:95 stop:856 length:762 start_codon:yes stop_codon:yes gene_type:complete
MKNFFLLFLFSSTLFVNSQKNIHIENVSFFKTDPFANLYFCNNNKLIKIDSQYNKLEYNFSEFGKLKKIISKNPMRITLFFEETQKIIFLDKNLNKLNLDLDLREIQNNIISDIDTHSNLIYLLAEKNQKICVYNFKKNKIIECVVDFIRKKDYLKLFLFKQKVILINNSEISILNNNLIKDSKIELEGCNDIFFDKDLLYVKKNNKLYKTKLTNLNKLQFIYSLKENELIDVNENVLYKYHNNYLSEETLSK